MSIVELHPPPRGMIVPAETGKVVDLDTGRWEHGCGSARFVLRRSGSVECAWCGELLLGLCWGEK